MTADEFQGAAIALLRSALGWQSAIARRLAVDRRTVQRWLRAGETPPWVDEKFAGWTGQADVVAWPRDEWVIGDTVGRDGRRREYIVHLQPPRFAARIVAVDEAGDPEPGEEPADVLSGCVYSSGDYLLCEIDWIDRPSPGEVTQLLEAAADAVDAAA